MSSSFFALFSRMNYINRWALMRNTREESLSQHSLEVAAFAHALAVIGNKRLGKSYDENYAAMLGIYHDMPEIITGDMPTPVKYFTPGMRETFGQIEEAAASALADTLPEDLEDCFKGLLSPDPGLPEMRLVKAADKLSALVKCITEGRSGNREFEMAEKTVLGAIKKMNCPEAEIFLEEFTGAYYDVLDTAL